ncbi:MAG: ribosome assembly cofactor RimP [Bacteroidota bacterium]
MEEKIIDLLDLKFAEAEFSNCFWIDVQLHTNKKLEVLIDCDEGVTFEQCRRISRYLESYIDEEGWLGEKYVLEVSSPGASRPLKLARQYPKHVGRKLEVKTNSGETYEGRLTEVTAETISLYYKVRRKEGKRKITEEITTVVPFADIKQAKVKISFNK